MEVITVEAQAFRELMAKVNVIAKFVIALQEKEKARESAENEPMENWVDSYEVCTFLKISEKTLQRMRSSRVVKFSRIRGKNFYKISEIQRLLDENLIRRTEEDMQNLIKNHKLHVEQRRNIKQNQ